MKLQTLLFLVVMVIFLTLRADAQNNGVVYQIPASEYSALVDLYNQASGADWFNNYGWLNPNATSWYGVYITGVQYDAQGNVVVQGNVQSVYLEGNHFERQHPYYPRGDLTQTTRALSR